MIDGEMKILEIRVLKITNGEGDRERLVDICKVIDYSNYFCVLCYFKVIIVIDILYILKWLGENILVLE